MARLLLSALLAGSLSACVYMGEDLPGEMQGSQTIAPAQEVPREQFATSAVRDNSGQGHERQAAEEQQREALNAGPAESSVATPSLPVEPDADEDAENILPERLEPTAAASTPGVKQLLAQARWAMKAGRLTHPAQFNARDYYQQVLQLDPANEEARAGLQQVLDRSIELSLHAANQGDFKRAELLLTRAERFALNDPGIRGAREYVHRLSRRGERSYALPPAAVRARDAAALADTLKLIAERAVENDATIEIRTAEDLQGLWLFDQLRQHAGNDPLHATIQAAPEPAIRLTWRR